jgi:hypothetical protein
MAPTIEMLLAVANRFSKSLDWIVRGGRMITGFPVRLATLAP